MPWTLTTCDNLRYAVTAGETAIELNSATGTADLCAFIGTPPVNHVVLEIYTALGSENVIAYACAGGKVTISRANSGTKATNWPVGTCVRTVQIIAGAICKPDADDPCCVTPKSVWDGLTTCPELLINTIDPLAPKLCIRPTGVVAGNYCGMVVNTTGQIMAIPANFPASCLPIFDPCACAPSAGGGATTSLPASSITYAPPLGSHYALGADIQTTTAQLDAAIWAVASAASAGVTSVTTPAGSGLTIGGTATAVTVSQTPTGVSPGVLGDYTVDKYGQILSYAPLPRISALTATAPIILSLIAGGYNISITQATTALYGTVKLVLPSDIAANTVANSSDVITWLGLKQWWLSYGPPVATTEGITGGTANIAVTPVNLKLNYPGLIAAVPPGQPDIDLYAFYSATALKHETYTGRRMMAELGGSIARAVVLPAGTSMISNENINTAVAVAGGIQYTLTTPALNNEFQVIVTIDDSAGTGVANANVFPSVQNISGASFIVRFFNGAGVGVTPVKYRLHVVSH